MHTRIKRALVTKAAAVIAYGSQTKEHLVLSLGKNADLIFLGSQVWPIQQNSKLPNYDLNPFLFLYIGYLNKRKRVEDIIHAFQRLSNTNAKLIIAGDGPERKHLENLALNDKSVYFVGYTDGINKKALLSEAHAFVMPSGFDNMPNSIIEAMAHALPIIATRQCNCPEWLKENALVYDAGDIDSLSSYMNILMNDRIKALQMARASLYISKKYDTRFATDAFLSAIIQAYNTIV
jgi:glycosyltransferase involved in cell wall biosynthesis